MDVEGEGNRPKVEPEVVGMKDNSLRLDPQGLIFHSPLLAVTFTTQQINS